MTTIRHPPARKRPVNLTLSEDLVSQAKGMTSNQSPPVDYVTHQHQEHQTNTHLADSMAAAWNTFNQNYGTFADEYYKL